MRGIRQLSKDSINRNWLIVKTNIHYSLLYNGMLLIINYRTD